MKRSIKGLLVVWAVLMTFIAVQGVGARVTADIEGEIVVIDTAPNKITVDVGDGAEIEVCGIQYNYLLNEYGIELSVGDTVSVEASVHVCEDGTLKYTAISITVGDVTVKLR